MKKVNIDIQITECTAGLRSPECVFYKDDLKRFDQKYTLKLKTASEYKVSVEVEPALQVAYMKLGGKKHEAIPMPNIHGQDTGKSTHTFVWSTKRIKTTESKYRVIFPCLIKFKGSGDEVSFDMMVKFYDASEGAGCDGTPLNSLSMEAVVGRGNHGVSRVTYN